MMRCKKATLHVLTAAMLLILLCGCSFAPANRILLESDSGDQQSANATTITFFGFKADAVNLTAIEEALNAFMEDNPDILVAYEGIKGQPYWDAFELRASTGNMDDIMMLDHDRILSLSAEGRLADLSDLSTLDNYIPWTRSQFTGKDGSVYFLPTCVSTYNLYINTDLLKEHDQKLPTNLSEFTEVCDYFAAQGITPIIANNYASLSTLIIAKGMYSVYSSENPAEEIEKFNNGEADLAEQLIPGLKMVVDMKERGWFNGEEVLATEQTSDDLDLFSQGTRPFMISGGWASPRLDVDFSYGVYPYPILKDGSVLAMNIDTCIGINAGSDNIDEAKKLLEFLTQPDIMWNYCDSQSSYSPLTDDRVPSDTTIVPSAPYITNGRSVLRSDYNLHFPAETALRECGNLIMQGGTLEDCIQLLNTMIYTS